MAADNNNKQPRQGPVPTGFLEVEYEGPSKTPRKTTIISFDELPRKRGFPVSNVLFKKKAVIFKLHGFHRKKCHVPHAVLERFLTCGYISEIFPWVHNYISFSETMSDDGGELYEVDYNAFNAAKLHLHVSWMSVITALQYRQTTPSTKEPKLCVYRMQISSYSGHSEYRMCYRPADVIWCCEDGRIEPRCSLHYSHVVSTVLPLK
jgi:hypothetical protein